MASGLCASAGAAIAKGDWAKAEAYYDRVLAMGVVDANVYNNLATLYDRRGIKQKEALDLLTRAHALAPNDANIKKNLLAGLAREVAPLAAERRYREMIPLIERRIAIEPESAAAQRDLGYCYGQLGDLTTALKYFTRAINLNPQEPTYYNDFGLACFELRMLTEAKGAFQQVLNLRPDSVVAYVHLGLLANLTGLPAIAINMLRRAVDIDPNCGEAHNNLALIYREQGFLKECREHYLQAVRLKPTSPDIYSSYLLSLNDDPNADPAWVAAEHKAFQARIQGPVRTTVSRDLDPSRKLRIAYLSPDLRQHSVAYFLLPLIEAHDRTRVDVTCYFSGNLADRVTERIRSSCDHWRAVYRMPDDELARQIAEDGIDILVELSGHTAENRLSLLARRAAPIQMTYLGYPNTTGLREMDYRITDAIADPPGKTEAWHTERLVWIDGGFLAFDPIDVNSDAVPVESPATSAGVVTFGSFNNLAKINEAVLETWAAILEGAPNSVLLLKAMGLRDDRVQDRIRAAFRARGIDAEKRVTMAAQERSTVDHLRLYNRVDVALDTFPYNGTTTTCEALWMGTPVVALLGASHAGRVSASLLARVGLDCLVCPTREAYIATAVAVGTDQARLRALRTGLRERFMASPSMDGRRLAAEFESAYAQAWRAYCEQATKRENG